jgi:hypothetical protein
VLSQLNLKPEVGKDEDPAPHQNMKLFMDVGRDLNESTDVIQRARFLRELENFMVFVGIEHSYRLKGDIPTVERYLEVRSGSVGCAPQIALTE